MKSKWVISFVNMTYLITLFAIAGCAQLNTDEIVGQDETQQAIGSSSDKISSYRTGHYRITISRDKKNWYKISGQNTFIQTQQCFINVTEQEALLSLRTAYKGGNGSLHFEREGCKIIGLYGSESL
jgi:hypothetical protein